MNIVVFNYGTLNQTIINNITFFRSPRRPLPYSVKQSSILLYNNFSQAGSFLGKIPERSPPGNALSNVSPGHVFLMDI